MAILEQARRLGAAEQGLVVVSTTRAGGSVQSSVVNAGVLPHPVMGGEVVGFVVRGASLKLRILRRRPRATAVFRSAWEWVGVEGAVELAGPDDALPGLDGEGLRRLLREVFTAAGGTHDDWDTYDRVMAAERRTAVLLRPERVYGNPSDSG